TSATATPTSTALLGQPTTLIVFRVWDSAKSVFIRGPVAKRVLERDQQDRRGDADLEELKRALRERASAISVRERELDRAERKLALRERRIGRRLRALRAERSWFTPVRNRRGGSGQSDQIERMRADLARREQALAAGETAA